jgi:glyoxylase-like metal-dependent hydrolase (beta-lactamase superfamily II)
MLRFVNEVARVHVLLQGSLSPTVSTCSLIVDGGALIVVDPGLAPGQEAITDPLRAMGIDPLDVTDVVISHHHPDHSLNVALFPVGPRPRPLGDLRLPWPVDDVEAVGRGVSPTFSCCARLATRPRTSRRCAGARWHGRFHPCLVDRRQTCR